MRISDDGRGTKETETGRAPASIFVFGIIQTGCVGLRMRPRDGWHGLKNMTQGGWAGRKMVIQGG